MRATRASLSLSLLFGVVAALGCSETNADRDSQGFAGHGGSGPVTGQGGGFAGAGGTGGVAGAGGTGGAGETPPWIAVDCDKPDPNHTTMVYSAAGCGDEAPEPVCVGAIPACISYACSCAGKVVTGCGVYFEPYAYRLGSDSVQGADCDPNGGGGSGGGHAGAGGS